ncbi:hypothetical protein PG996_016130 [Apiospora saccharicola]|uniref:DNA2/NAM7 helicase-like C-terminal domain-containing protein n=1 Tax=Apiospora saccharicola TaxID=335842 RepID=A0ABR1TQD4_9PEZI
MLSALRSFARLDEEVVDEGGVVWDGNTPGGELLNAGQSEAVRAALTHPLVSIWGPPGTGKTQTIVEILLGLQQKFPAERILVTAPTHNAVDNVMRRFAKSPRIDEASQQTEPASLVPLTKGCRRAVLVGDHVQLRPTVQPVTAALTYDVSLFERLYTSGGGRGGVRTCMLNTQYRMHPVISEFSSREFYGGELRTGISSQDWPLAASAFPWPPKTSPQGGGGGKEEDVSRTIFIECAGREDLGQKSKRNQGQAELCRRVCQLLLDAPPSSSTTTTGPTTDKKPKTKQSIAVLTPYTTQMTLLKSSTAALAGLEGGGSAIEVSSIDGFQGREADIVVSEENAAGMLWKRLLESLTRVEVDEAAEMKRERLG